MKIINNAGTTRRYVRPFTLRNTIIAICIANRSFIFNRLFSSPGKEILKGPHQTV